MYHIKSVRFIPTIGAGGTGTGALCQVATASPGWVTTSAWKKAKRIHTQMQSGRGGAPGSGLPDGLSKATWSDFKVYLDLVHYGARATFNVPEDSYGGDANITNSEWIYSEFTSPVEGGGDDQFTTHLLGDDSGSAGTRNSAGIVKGFQESRRTVEQDNTDAPIDTANAWMIQIFDDGDTLDEIAQNLLGEGDLPPYDIDDYPGGDDNLEKPMTRQMSTVVTPTPANFYLPTATMSGFNAPCGLIQTTFTTDQASMVYHVVVDVALGSYKGVKALPM